MNLYRKKETVTLRTNGMSDVLDVRLFRWAGFYLPQGVIGEAAFLVARDVSDGDDYIIECNDGPLYEIESELESDFGVMVTAHPHVMTVVNFVRLCISESDKTYVLQAQPNDIQIRVVLAGADY